MELALRICADYFLPVQSFHYHSDSFHSWAGRWNPVPPLGNADCRSQCIGNSYAKYTNVLPQDFLQRDEWNPHCRNWTVTLNGWWLLQGLINSSLREKLDTCSFSELHWDILFMCKKEREKKLIPEYQLCKAGSFFSLFVEQKSHTEVLPNLCLCCFSAPMKVL